MPEQKTGQKTGLVITAHPGDFVWRAGGAIALHAKRGYKVKIVCLSFGGVYALSLNDTIDLRATSTTFAVSEGTISLVKVQY